MLVKILGVIDLIGGLILIFGKNADIPNLVLIFFGLIFLIKSSLGLLKDFASWIDLVGGLFFLLTIIVSVPEMICFVIGILIIQKSVFSFL